MLKLIKENRQHIYMVFHIIVLQTVVLSLMMYGSRENFFRVQGRVTGGLVFSLKNLYINSKYTYLIIPIAEEMIFREKLYDFFKRRTKFHNVIQALLCGVFHIVIFDEKYVLKERLWLVFISSFIIGIICGNIREMTGSINMCIFFHIIYAFTSVNLGPIYIDLVIRAVEKFSRLKVTGVHTGIYIIIVSLALFILSFIKVDKGIYSLWKGKGRN